MTKKTFCIIVPVYNEEEIILDIISKGLKFVKKYKAKIIVINDGSKDSTKKKLDKIKSKKILIFNKKNEGHGKTIIFGYKKAIKMKTDYILQIDSDDQIPFEEFEKLIKYKNKYDFVIGNRNNRDDPLSRILISLFMKIMIFLLFGKYVIDPNCPLRIMKTTFLKTIINKISFSIVPNILISVFAKKRNSLKSVNIKHKKRYTGKSYNFIKLFKLCILSLLNIFKFRFL